MPLFAEVAATAGTAPYPFCQSGKDDAKISASLASSSLPLSDVLLAALRWCRDAAKIEGVSHDNDLRALWDSVIEVDHVLIQHAYATGRHSPSMLHGSVVP